jgi:hypothetical protein
MIHAAGYRAKAADCARRAEEAQDDYHRKNFVQLAEMWTEMADKAENRDAGADDGTRDDQSAVDEALATIRNAEPR